MKVDMNLLKQLRDATLASLVECKKALIEADGNLDEAKQILKEKGATKAAKKADRETNEGATKSISKDGKVYSVTLFCETDFVAKNDTFAELVDTLLSTLEGSEDAASFEELSQDKKDALDTIVKEHVLTLGENLQLGSLFVKSGNAFVYNHNGGKVSAIVYYEGTNEDAVKEVALQITAMSPEYVSADNVPADTIATMTEKAKQELEGQNKPADIIDKIVAGKVSKGLEDFVLLEQVYIRD